MSDEVSASEMVIDASFVGSSETRTHLPPTTLAKLRSKLESDPQVHKQEVRQAWLEACRQVSSTALPEHLRKIGVHPAWIDPDSNLVSTNGTTTSNQMLVRSFTTDFHFADQADPNRIPQVKQHPKVVEALQQLRETLSGLHTYADGNPDTFALDKPPLESAHHILRMHRAVAEVSQQLGRKTASWIRQL